MSYAVSESLQRAVYEALNGNIAVTGLVGGHIYDAIPFGELPSLYIAIGEEKVRDNSTKTSSGAMHDMTVGIHGDVAGFQALKDVAAAVSDALGDVELVLARGVLTSLRFRSARARKGLRPNQRMINLTFRAFVVDV